MTVSEWWNCFDAFTKWHFACHKLWGLKLSEDQGKEFAKDWCNLTDAQRMMLTNHVAEYPIVSAK
jgi:hypothetical protein